MKNTTTKLIYALIITFFLASCGNKGDLYVPKKDDVKKEQLQ